MATTTTYHWLAAEVAGTTENLTIKLNEVENQGYEIFAVTALVFPNAHGWVVVGRKESSKVQEKEKPPQAEADKERERTGTVTLHKPRRS
jgi:uncharacterized protein (DUF2141 family)